MSNIKLLLLNKLEDYIVHLLTATFNPNYQNYSCCSMYTIGALKWLYFVCKANNLLKYKSVCTIFLSPTFYINNVCRYRWNGANGMDCFCFLFCFAYIYVY